MLSLDSRDWEKLTSAYGDAREIPALLGLLEELPDDDGESEPWFTLWSSLAHQGDVYSGSFAAVPHIVAALASAPGTAPAVYFHFPAWVEICRRKTGIELPNELAGAYNDSLKTLRAIAARALGDGELDECGMRCALAAVAAASGEWNLSELLLELSPDVAEECLEWLSER